MTLIPTLGIEAGEIPWASGARHPIPGFALGTGARVAVVDSGWHRKNPDRRVLRGRSFVRSTGSPLHDSLSDQDRIGHGTAIGTIILRIAPNVVLLPLQIFDSALDASIDQLIAAIDYAAASRATLINLSLTTTDRAAFAPLYAACQRACQAGCVVVAAGAKTDSTVAPAMFDNVIGVAPGAFDATLSFRYRDQEALECIGGIAGTPPRGPFPGTNPSYATATITGILARHFAGQTACSLEAARHFLQQQTLR